MCGICGFYTNEFFSKEEIASIIQKMNDAIIHRGPDEEGFFIENNIAIASKRLRIIDLNKGRQPINNEDNTITIVYNGEIYNFLELKEELLKKGHIFKTNTDTEVVIHSFEEYAEECLPRFNGMFAFCIYDKNKNTFFLARDRLGVKPLYFYFKNKTFIFASEIKSILKYPKINKELDILGLSDYLTYDYTPAPKTIFTNITKLLPGHYLIFKNNEIKIKKYWDINKIKVTHDSEEEICKKIKFLLGDAVKKRLISDVPLGVFLSGGIDSSAIVYFMENLTDSIKTFSIGFEEKDFDESKYAKQVARIFNTQHYQMTVTNKMVLNLLPDIINFIDEPVADPACLPTFFVSQLAREKVKVVLSGEGGDELFAGYENYRGIKFAKMYKTIIPAFINNILINPLVQKLPTSFSYIPFDYKAKKFTANYDLPLEYANFIWKGGFSANEKLLLFKDDYAKTITTNNSFNIIDKYIQSYKTNDELNKILYLDMKLYLADNLLFKVDRMSMANSLEVRTPFLDYRLVEYAMSIPANLKLSGLKTKYIFKKVMQGKIPDGIINRKKKGFGIPVSLWLSNKKFKNFILEVLSKKAIEKQGYFKYNFINEILQQHFKMKKDNRKLIWGLLVFGMWHEKYVG